MTLLLVGCRENNRKENYFPMRIGSAWTYDACDWLDTPSGTETLSSGIVKVQAARDDKLPSGEDVVLIVYTNAYKLRDTVARPDTITQVDSLYFRTGGDCILEYDSKADTTVADTVLKLPLAKDVTWLRSGTHLRVTEESDVSVKAGIYRTWKVEAIVDTSLHASESWWYADGVGEVKWHRVDATTPGRARVTHWELDSATIR